MIDTQEGSTRGWGFQVGDAIKKPLGSVARITAKGNRVVFESDHGYIENKVSGELTWFAMRDNVYVLDALVRPCQQGFPRPS